MSLPVSEARMGRLRDVDNCFSSTSRDLKAVPEALVAEMNSGDPLESDGPVDAFDPFRPPVLD
jgi:hypothetical protein